ncbi:hypothetical protein [Pseudoflavonifractor sp. MCC625]|uniref:hypothetical protein n=1 Tax=Pseudoflavonifractor sp. MCC625 TaxID=2592647 RepID=UPI001C0181FC|nr:hypothetical protein [Pseudoflavonifractor sp. MCC625]MBT9685162.1 hypothetical protein [Pseudoflavonifractor sp. MCC625]
MSQMIVTLITSHPGEKMGEGPSHMFLRWNQLIVVLWVMVEGIRLIPHSGEGQHGPRREPFGLIWPVVLPAALAVGCDFGFFGKPGTRAIYIQCCSILCNFVCFGRSDVLSHAFGSYSLQNGLGIFAITTLSFALHKVSVPMQFNGIIKSLKCLQNLQRRCFLRHSRTVILDHLGYKSHHPSQGHTRNPGCNIASRTLYRRSSSYTPGSGSPEQR